jgi:hypothetical protein
VQDGFQLYLHGFIVTAAGKWCVVQQGLSEERREARRYHWLSENLTSFLDSPHAAIEGRARGAILNLADVRAQDSRCAGLELANAGPDRTLRVLRRYRDAGSGALELFPETEPRCAIDSTTHLRMPAHHDVRASDVMLRRLHATLASAAECGPGDFADLLLLPGVGARTVAALAFVAEIIYGAPSRFADPARFSLALGGKDGHPYPVPLRVYDETIQVLKSAVSRAKLGHSDRLHAIRRLDGEARALERFGDRTKSGAAFESIVASERARSPAYGGRTVLDP